MINMSNSHEGGHGNAVYDVVVLTWLQEPQATDHSHTCRDLKRGRIMIPVINHTV